MATTDPQVLVSVLTGETQMGFMRFLQGQPVAPITVGLEGNWRISAPGVARAHVSLLFDGQQLYAAALSPDVPVFINGTPIDGRWWVLQAPSELRFGHACLRVALERPSHPAPAPGVRHPSPFPGDRLPMGGTASPTFLDAAGQWESQHREEERIPGKKTQIYDSSMVPPGPIAPAIRPGAGHRPQTPFPARPPQPAQVAPVQPAPVVPVQPAPVVPVQPARVVPVQQAAATAHSAQPPPAAAAAQPAVVVKAPGEPDKGHSLLPISSEPMVSTMRRPLLEDPGQEPPAGAPPQGAPLPGPPHAEPRPASAVAAAATMAVDASVWARPPNANASMEQLEAGLGATQNDALGAPPGKKKPNALVAAWRSASLVKKITFFLLPVAFAAVLWPEAPPPAGPAPTVRGSGSASPTPSATPVRAGAAASATSASPKQSASPKASAAPLAGSASAAPVTGSASAAPPPLTASVATAVDAGASATKASAAALAEAKKAGAAAASASADAPAAARSIGPAERYAVDAAFAGKWAEAVRFYDLLAEARPDDPVFREAARIIRETKINPK
jgi:hypothetical protein